MLFVDSLRCALLLLELVLFNCLLIQMQCSYACETMVKTYIKDKLRARVKQVISEEQEARAQFKRTYSAASPSLYMLLCLTFPFLSPQARLEKELQRRLQFLIRPKKEAVLLALAVLKKTAQKRKQKDKSKAEVRREAIAAVPAQEDLLLQPD